MRTSVSPPGSSSLVVTGRSCSLREVPTRPVPGYVGAPGSVQAEAPTAAELDHVRAPDHDLARTERVRRLPRLGGHGVDEQRRRGRADEERRRRVRAPCGAGGGVADAGPAEHALEHALRDAEGLGVELVGERMMPSPTGGSRAAGQWNSWFAAGRRASRRRPRRLAVANRRLARAHPGERAGEVRRFPGYFTLDTTYRRQGGRDDLGQRRDRRGLVPRLARRVPRRARSTRSAAGSGFGLGFARSPPPGGGQPSRRPRLSTLPDESQSSVNNGVTEREQLREVSIHSPRRQSRARPTTAASAPRGERGDVRRRGRPPAASTGRPDAATRADELEVGPASVPSRSIAVQRTRATPAARQRATASSSDSPSPRSSRAVRTWPSRTSSATTSRSPSASTHGAGPGTRRCRQRRGGARRRAAPPRRRASGSRRRPAARARRPRRRRARAPAGRARARAVEIDEVDAARAGLGEPPRERDRVAGASTTSS